MKKRLLVTSIVMMLVVAVALSTATYAWFTSNATVSASSITLTADTSTSTALGIGWTGGTAGTSISSNMSGTLAPMCPVNLQDGTTTTAATDVTTNNIVFKTQTTKQVDSQFVFNGGGEAATPITYSNGSVSSFYVKNLSNANTVGSITISAVFATDSDVAGSGNAYTYAPIMTQKIAAQATYYTRLGTAPNFAFEEHTAAAEMDNANFAAASGTAQEGVKYYSLVGTTYTLDTTIEDGASVANHYTMTETNFARTVTSKESLTSDVKNGDNMVRIAIFRKTPVQIGTTNTYTYNGTNYTLIGVLGNANTAYQKVTSGSFDKNTTYYVADNASNPTTYTQTNIVSGSGENGFDTYLVGGTNEGKLYTATNTAVYGSIAADEPVKNLFNHKVSTELQLLDNNYVLGTESTVELVAIAWLDGTVFDDTRAGDIASVSLKFHA